MTSPKMFPVLALFFAVFMAGASFAADNVVGVPGVKPAAPPPVTYNSVGDGLPAITLDSVRGGEKVALDKISRPTMLLFVNSACVACRAELSSFGDMASKLKGKVDVFVVTTDFDPANSLTRIEKAVSLVNYTDVLADSEFKAGNAIGIDFTPATVIINASGKQAYRKGGFNPNGPDQGIIAGEIVKLLKK